MAGNPHKEFPQLQEKLPFLCPLLGKVALLTNSRLYLYGGIDSSSGVSSQFYCLDLDCQDNAEWKEIIPVNLSKEACEEDRLDVPGKLFRHSAVIYKDAMIIIGGKEEIISNSNKTFSYNFLENKWNQYNGMDEAIDSHSSLIYENTLIVFGGFKRDYTNDLILISLENGEKQLVDGPGPKPKPRASACSTLIGSDLYIFGGTNGLQKLNDFWKFSISGKTWCEIVCEGPLPLVFNLS